MCDGEVTKKPKHRSRCCGIWICKYTAVLLAILCGVGFHNLPQPRDVNGRPLLETSVLLEAYWGLFQHTMGFAHPKHGPAPRLSAEALDAAPAEWDMRPLPVLRAGVDFTNREELMKAFESYRNKQPVVVKGFLNHESAANWASNFQKLANPWWNTEYLRDELAGVEVRVFENYSTDDSIVWWDFKEYADEIMTNASTIAYARAVTEHWEVREHMLEAFDYELVDDLSGRPSLYKSLLKSFHDVVGPIAVFVSGKVPTTRLHSDSGESFVFHTEGSKHWRFFQPDMSILLKPFTMVRSVGYISSIDVFKPDFQAEPQLRLARGFEVTTEPGDMIYFPSQTWHGVENRGDRNVIFDIARLDVPRAFGRNWPQTLATALHPGGAVNLFKYCYLGVESNDGHRLPAKYSCGKEVFFQNFASKQRYSEKKK